MGTSGSADPARSSRGGCDCLVWGAPDTLIPESPSHRSLRRHSIHACCRWIEAQAGARQDIPGAAAPDAHYISCVGAVRAAKPAGNDQHSTPRPNHGGSGLTGSHRPQCSSRTCRSRQAAHLSPHLPRQTRQGLRGKLLRPAHLELRRTRVQLLRRSTRQRSNRAQRDRRRRR